MTPTTYAEFEAKARAAGFDEVLERNWAPDAVIATHTHGFDVDALVTQGQMWLGCEGRTRHLKAGETFTLARNTPHDERYGARGAIVWVARRNSR